MKKIMFILFVFSLTGFQKPSDLNEKMKPFTWMLGDWAMYTGSGTITESWKMKNDSTYEGESMMIKNNGEVKPFEDIQLVYRNHEYYYIPVTAGQNDEKPVPFKLTS
mgnify:CR=1 FL=1